MTTDALQQVWRDLNARFFDDRLPPIGIVWSPRLTASAGMFVSRGGPRSAETGTGRRLIRLSLPLLQGPAGPASPGAGEAEMRGTLAHEMIHQWQFDLLKRRPNHGADFRRKMEAMNREGLGISIRHDLAEAVRPWLRYAWRCLGCGRIYERQRRTIRPGRHRCGACRGPLREVAATPAHAQPPYAPDAGARQQQMELDLALS